MWGYVAYRHESTKNSVNSSETHVTVEMADTCERGRVYAYLSPPWITSYPQDVAAHPPTSLLHLIAECIRPKTTREIEQ